MGRRKSEYRITHFIIDTPLGKSVQITLNVHQKIPRLKLHKKQLKKVWENKTTEIPDLIAVKPDPPSIQVPPKNTTELSVLSPMEIDDWGSSFSKFDDLMFGTNEFDF